MKNKSFRLLALCLVAALMFVFAAYSTGTKVRLTLTVDADILYNNSVGSDWYTAFWVEYNGQNYYCSNDGAVEFSYYLGDSISIHSYVKEDDSYPDTAGHVSYASLYADDILNGSYCWYTHTLTVVEDRGRYAGNTAKWEIQFVFEATPAATPKPSPKDADDFLATPKADNTPKPTASLMHAETTTSPKALPGFVFWDTPTPTPIPTPTTTIKTNNNLTKSLASSWAWIFAVLAAVYIFARIITFAEKTKEERAAIKKAKEEAREYKALCRSTDAEILRIVKSLPISDKEQILDSLKKWSGIK